MVLALCCLIIIDARNGIKKWRQIWHQTFMVSSVYWDQAWRQKLFQTNIFKLKKWFMGLIEPVIPYKMPQTRTFFDVLLWFMRFFFLWYGVFFLFGQFGQSNIITLCFRRRHFTLSVNGKSILNMQYLETFYPFH